MPRLKSIRKSRPCERCGNEFVPKKARGRFCTRSCAAASHPHPTLSDRTWIKVDQSSDADACWHWTGGRNKDGYGQIKIEGVQTGVHRVVWELTYGPIPPGLMVLHKCDERYPVDDKTYRRCCNPAHLFLGTHEDNMRDMAEKGRSTTGSRNAHTTHPESFGQAWRQQIGNRSYEQQRGALNPKAKLNEADVQTIRHRYAQGETPTAIAKDFPVTAEAIGNIAARRSWRHVA